MKLLLKILLFILLIFQTNISEVKIVVFDNVVSETISTVNAVENKNELQNTILENNDFGLACKNESKLID